jgi:predicted site-specific integrase-resolvase
VLVGYARVSTDDQDLTLQRTALKQAGCKRIYEEKVSGVKRDRPELTRMLDQLREGDQGSRINPVYPYDRSAGGSEVSSFARPSRVREPQALRSQPQA